MRTRILTVMALLLAATSVFAAKKDKKAEEAPIYAIKSGIIITRTDMAAMRERFENVDTAAMRERFGNMGGNMGGANFNAEEMRQRFAERAGSDSTMMQAFGDFGNFTFDENAENVTLVYFDDYGAKQATVTKMGGRTTRTITDADGATITINEEQKTATKMPAMGGARGGRGGMGGFGGFGGFGMGGGTSAPVNFNALDEKTIKKNKVQELGTEVIAGRECTIYSVRTTMMQQYVTNRYWVYKGIVLQSETAGFMDDEPMLTTVTELQETEVPADIFTVPAGITVTERDFGGMMMMGGMGGGDFGGGMGGGFGGGMGGGFGGGMGGGFGGGFGGF